MWDIFGYSGGVNNCLNVVNEEHMKSFEKVA